MNPIEKLLDENNNENIVLYDENGNALEFEQIALIVLGGNVYPLLHPLVQEEGIDEDTGLVFQIIVTDDGEEVLEVVDDEEVVDAVFEEYYALLEQAQPDAE